MAEESLWKRLTTCVPSFGASLAIHVALLVVLAMVTWVVVSRPTEDRTLSLRDQDVVSDEGDTAPGVSGSLAGSGGDPKQARRRDPAVVQPAVPAPSALEAAVAELMKTPPAAELPPGRTETARQLMDSLAAATDLGGKAVGTGSLAGTSHGFGKEIAGLRRRGLDIVLVLDATDSMAPYIEQAKKRLQQVVDVVTHLVPRARFGVVAFKDYGDDYGPEAVRSLKVTTDYAAVRKFINDITAGGGADEPEPINSALAVATSVRRMGWKSVSKRVIILVGDSAVHPSGRKEAFQHAREFARNKRSTINVIDVGGAGDQGAKRAAAKPDLAEIARSGAGKAFLLRDANAFWRHLIVSVFGKRYEQDVNTIIKMVAEKK